MPHDYGLGPDEASEFEEALVWAHNLLWPEDLLHLEDLHPQLTSPPHRGEDGSLTFIQGTLP